MKLCPQCEFIYEDEQSFCDMDGTGLVYKLASEPPRSRLTIPLVAESNSPARRSGSFALSALVVIVLAGLVIVYVARTRQTRALQPTQSSLQAPDLPVRSSEQVTAGQPSAADQTSTSVSSEAPVASTPPAPEQTGDSTSVETSSSNTPPPRSRLNTGPVSAGSSAANSHGPVMVRLTNGAVIPADDAWENKQGVWYRQAGMVTFLKRSNVRSIDRVATSQRSQSTTANTTATNSPNQSAKKPGTRDQLHIAKLEPVKPKKDSRVTSFLKKTGNILKKPFRF